jgi:uncharacterized protein YndB with AHSA1/START domain
MSNPIIIEQTFSASPETVWNAITDIKQMKQWYFPELEEFKPEVGFETRFTVNANGTDYPHIWRITVVEPYKKIVYHWAYEGYAGDSFVSWELMAEGSGTKLRLVHSGIETFPQDNSDFSRESCTAGWTHIVCKSLKEYLEKPE